MLRTCGGIRRAHMHLCCQGVCEVCKLAVLGLQPRFDPRGFIFFTQTGIVQDCSFFGFTDLSPDLGGIVTGTKGRLSHLFWLLANLPPVWRRRRCRHGRGWKESFHMPQHDWLEFQPAGASQKAWTGIYLEIFLTHFCLALALERLLNAVFSPAQIRTQSLLILHFPLLFVVVDLIWANIRTELSLLDSLKQNNWLWPALPVIRQHAERALV